MSRGHKFIFKVIVVGDAAVGKTSLMFRFVHGSFQRDYKMTIGVNFATKMVTLDGGTKVKLSIWDTAGQERFHFLLPSYYDGSSGGLVVFDVTRRESFTNLAKWVEQVRGKTGNIPLLIIGNKADLEDLRAVTQEEAKQFAQQNGVVYTETSAKTGENVNDVFAALTQFMTELQD
ncbi:Rab family GTPase [Candidatus Borrarchaeum sp.]|uniref:Rab family GTPase n=1 Tax=Candidatus Borrarchaeum sp. TaxID=2846742 RepID=UPI00257D7181|nr:Rab family GTPase [Candidatus Borrarchaeum sp.]